MSRNRCGNASCRRSRARLRRRRTTSAAHPGNRSTARQSRNHDKWLRLAIPGTRRSARRSRDASPVPGDFVSQVEFARTPPAREHAARLLVAVVQVPGGASSHPWCKLVRDGAIVRALTVIPEVPGDRPPASSVPDAGAGQRVRDFVQQNLMHLVIRIAAGEVARHGDPVLVKAAQPGPRLRVVESERPHVRVEVERDERLRPPSHPVQLCHASRLCRATGFLLDGARHAKSPAPHPHREGVVLSGIPVSAAPGRCSSTVVARGWPWRPS